MNIKKWLVFAGAAAVITVVSALAVQADTSPLAVTCNGVATGATVAWTASPTGGNTSGTYTLAWSGANVSGTSTVTTATYTASGTYLAMIQVTDASSSVATSTCSAVVTIPPAVVTTPTSTPPIPRVNPPSLLIGSNGSFLARGMTVTSVASGSFQGTVWGITYTVNWSENFFPEFFFRKGNIASSTTNPINQVQVGDEVGVSGFVTTANPMVVNANVVRDYSITMPRPGLHRGNEDSPFYNGEGNGDTNSSGASASASAGFSTHLQDLLNQLHNLQDLFNKGRGNH